MTVVTRCLAALALALLLPIPVAAAQSTSCAESVADCFVDAVGKASSADRAYRRLHAAPEAHHLLALAQDFAYLAIGTTWYWLARDKNLVDWDRPSAKQRFTLDVIRMDNNEFPINFTLHPWSGAAYYTAARSNGLSFGVSSAYAFGAMLLWEYGIEFKEKVSFNDLIFTPLPGISLGEFFSRLFLYVNRYPGPPTRTQRVVSVLVGPLQALADGLTGQDKRVPGAADRLGYSAEIHHRFRIHAGVALQAAGGRDGLFADFGVDGAFVSVPSHLRRGRFRRVLHDADFSRLWLSFVQGAGEREFDSYADVSLLGIYEQKISADARGGFFFLGTSLGYRYRRSLFDGFHDEVAATHLPGLALETALLFGRSISAHVSYRLQPDFAGIRSLSYSAWQAAHPDAQGKTVTEKHGYLYAFGLTSLLEARLCWGWLELGGRSWFAVYNSKEGLDRSQETLTADPKGYERVLDAESFLRLAPFPVHALKLELLVLARRRFSRLGGFETRAELLRASARLVLSF